MGLTVEEIWRYPVKSMAGEQLASVEVTERGLEGDRVFAVVDAADHKVASAKHPRKWAVLLACRARWAGGGRAEITLPDGSSVASDDPGVHEALSGVVGRPVRLESAVPAGSVFEEVWPEIPGLAPAEIIDATNIGTTEDGERVSQFDLAMGAPAGTFFDVAQLHVLTRATLDHLAALAPDADFDVRRYRPNFLVGGAGSDGFVENDWPGRTLGLGSLTAKVSIPVMRCVMTTLAQDALAEDRRTLRTIAAHNRIEIPGLGTWACAGVYADVVAGGAVAVGDGVSLS